MSIYQQPTTNKKNKIEEIYPFIYSIKDKYNGY